MTRFDLWLNKQFRVRERKYFQLRLAAFNATNTPIFQAPASLVITAQTFGRSEARRASGMCNWWRSSISDPWRSGHGLSISSWVFDF